MYLKSFFYTVGTVVLFCGACNSNNQQQQNTTADTTQMDTDTTVAETDTGTAVATQDSIPLTLVNGAVEQKGMMEKGKHIVFSFDVPKPGKLQASVKPDETNGNVRIAQIFMPDNTADGPFGMDMSYDLKQTGKYRLVISENQMAGDPYNGPFTLTIKLAK
ncbi:hypothetical protein GCM10023231_04790 [Olivibacter ginsenosidimutans]|uniref:YtkA-like domain-containing protein n=1 Tax=Olivibacter ginsenosidimutans TaxID=1176537 RepID=A0ABP9AH90_9SPHI